ncbi:MAG: hypothetical protein J6Z34_04610 [Clostridia bacterium]|nr:hypothetical protein [Clostridia bacterium]
MQIYVRERKVEEENKKLTSPAEISQSEPAPDPKEEMENGRLRIALNLSVIGLILSVFAGLGVFFGVAGAITGAVNRRENENASRYAIGIGIAATALSVIFAVLFAVAAALSVINKG